MEVDCFNLKKRSAPRTRGSWERRFAISELKSRVNGIWRQFHKRNEWEENGQRVATLLSSAPRYWFSTHAHTYAVGHWEEPRHGWVGISSIYTTVVGDTRGMDGVGSLVLFSESARAGTGLINRSTGAFCNYGNGLWGGPSKIKTCVCFGFKLKNLKTSGSTGGIIPSLRDL